VYHFLLETFRAGAYFPMLFFNNVVISKAGVKKTVQEQSLLVSLSWA
jgi:hypothetical protein